jgi:hypothetical protein
VFPPNHQAASAWLAAVGASHDRVGDYQPRTLKQVLDGALALGAAAGRLEEAMRLVAGIEIRLAELARTLHIDRRSGSVAGVPAPRIAIVSAIDRGDIVLPGGWVPGLAAAAGAAAVGPVEGGPDVRIAASRLSMLAPDVVIVALDRPPAHVPARTHKTILEAGRRGGAVQTIDGTRFIKPDPLVARSIELIAYIVHRELSGVTPEAGEVGVWNAGPPE